MVDARESSSDVVDIWREKEGGRRGRLSLKCRGREIFQKERVY